MQPFEQPTVQPLFQPAVRFALLDLFLRFAILDLRRIEIIRLELEAALQRLGLLRQNLLF